MPGGLNQTQGQDQEADARQEQRDAHDDREQCNVLGEVGRVQCGTQRGLRDPHVACGVVDRPTALRILQGSLLVVGALSVGSREARLEVEAQTSATFIYSLKPPKRGQFSFGLVAVRHLSRWRLAWSQTTAGEPTIVVKYPQDEKRIVIPANAHVVRNAFGSKDDLKAGAAFRANAAAKQPDGTYTASAISVGRDGARPF